MEITTIIGIVIAIIICLIGLRMLLRKSDDAAPSLDSQVHINAETNQPVIPRHVRDQIRAETSETTVTERVEPGVKALDQVVVDEDTTSAQSQKADEQSIAPVKSETETATQQVEPAESAGEHVHNVETPVDTPAKADVAEPAELEAAATAVVTEATSSVEDIEAVKTTDIKADDKAPAATFDPTHVIETAEIQEFDAESSILDVHLHEQQRFDDECSLANAESFIVLNVMPNPRKALSGDKTLKVLLKYGLRYGEMSCFHRYEDPEKESSLMFSVLRITDEGPNGFDLESLSMEMVQGLAFFLALPHNDVQKGFDTMVSIAGLIARETDGTVYDENNLEFTPQLKEHWRHVAIDYRAGQQSVDG